MHLKNNNHCKRYFNFLQYLLHAWHWVDFSVTLSIFQIVLYKYYQRSNVNEAHVFATFMGIYFISLAGFVGKESRETVERHTVLLCTKSLKLLVAYH